MTKTVPILAALLSFTVAGLVEGSPAQAGDRYGNRPPVIVSPDLTAPWVMQLRSNTQQPVVYRQMPRPEALDNARMRGQALARQRQMQRAGLGLVQPVSMPRAEKPVKSQIDPQFLPQKVSYDSAEKPGTIVIDTNNRFLYLVTGKGEARRYGVGVGKPGFEWAGVHTVSRKAEWPVWTPPSEMVAREAAKGHYLPATMEGGPANPLGARAMYLGSTLYRIHGTNAPWTIGFAVSSGCIRMRNEDVVDLYERVSVGTKVIVI